MLLLCALHITAMLQKYGANMIKWSYLCWEFPFAMDRTSFKHVDFKLACITHLFYTIFLAQFDNLSIFCLLWMSYNEMSPRIYIFASGALIV